MSFSSCPLSSPVSYPLTRTCYFLPPAPLNQYTDIYNSKSPTPETLRNEIKANRVLCHDGNNRTQRDKRTCSGMMCMSDWRWGLTSEDRHRNKQAFPRSWSRAYLYREDSKQETEQDIMREARQETQKDSSSPRRRDCRCQRGGSTLTRSFHGALTGDTSKSQSPPTTPLLLVSAPPALHLS